MEVSGKVTYPLKQIPTLCCVPCERDDLNEPAHGYCQDCQEHLCETCFQHHRRSRPSRDHVLLDKDDMPLQSTNVDLNPDIITNACSNHRGKTLEFFCNNHNTLACYVCVALEHKQCQVDYIPNVSGDVSDELKDLITKMEVLVKKCESNVQKTINAKQQLGQSYEKAAEEIRLFRKEINAHLDIMESRMLKEAKSLVNKAKHEFGTINDTCVEITEEVKRSKSLLTVLNTENKKNKLFIEMKNFAPRLASLSDKERQTIAENKSGDTVKFVGNKEMLEELKSDKSFGMITRCYKPSADDTVFIQQVKAVKMKISSDQHQCDIIGMIMISSTHLVVVDCGNEKIRLIDVVNNKILSEGTLSSIPKDIAKLPKNKLAVTLPLEKCIQVMSYTESSLFFDRRINVDECCYPIAYCQDKLVVGSNIDTEKLLILDLDGNIIQMMDTPRLYTGTKKIVISSDQKYLYVSNYYFINDATTSKCIKMDWEGNTVGRFQHPGYKSPVGIQELEDGTVLVCFKDSDNIVRLSSSFNRCEIVILQKTNIYHPGALAYNQRDNELFVSCSSRKESYAKDTIKIFKIKWIK